MVTRNKNWHFSAGILNTDPECVLNHEIKSKQCAVLKQLKEGKWTEVSEKEFKKANQNRVFYNPQLTRKAVLQAFQFAEADLRMPTGDVPAELIRCIAA